MATKKQLTNRFQSDIDLCNNQIKNAAFEYWDKTTLPTDNLFEGRHIYLLKNITIPIEGGKTYTYESGSVCVCHEYEESGTMVWGWIKQLSSLQSEDVSGAIKELWKEKTGRIHVYDTKALMEADKANAWEMDIAIVKKDESTADGDSTLYIAIGKDPTGPDTSACDHWALASVIDRANVPKAKVAVGGGTSYISNETGDDGACMKFVRTTDGMKSAVSVHNGTGTGPTASTLVEMYALNKDNDGTRILMHQDKAYYLGPGENRAPIAKDEIATIGDLETGASRCWGTVNTYADMLSITGMDVTDYVYVLHDEEQQRLRKIAKGFEESAPSTRYHYTMDGGNHWEYSCDIANTSIRDLGIAPGTVNEPYHFTFYYEPTVSKDKINIAIDTITLDNRKTIKRYDLDIIGASQTTAGLMTGDDKKKLDESASQAALDAEITRAKAAEAELDKKKLDLMKSSEFGEKQPLVPWRAEFNATGTTAEQVVVDLKTLDMSKNENRVVDKQITVPGATLTADKKTVDKAGLYSKTAADAKLNIYGEMAPDQPCRVPYFFEVSYEADKAKVTDHTITLDNNQTKEKFDLFINSMNYADNKAGLYTKAMADAKLDILTGAPDGKAYKLPYYFEAVPDANGIRVKSHTITLDNKKEVDTTSYFIDVVGATADKAGLMTAADKTKLDGLVVDEYSTPEATDKAMSVRLAMEKIKELGHDFVGAVATHADLATLEFKPGSTTKKIDINDIAVVLDDSDYPGTPSHNKECWRYRCTDVSKLGTVDAWSPEYRVSNIPFTAKQWNMINAYEIEETNGLSYISNLKGDAGACLKFVNNDGTKSAIAVNDGGKNGVAAQIYAIGASATDGVKLNVRKSGLYYLKNKATPATEDPDDEIATVGGTIAKLGEVPGAPAGTKYRFPFNIFDPVQNQNNITAVFQTLILDDNTSGGDYTITIPAADFSDATQLKAGLYTKTLADLKVDRTVKDAQNAYDIIDNSYSQNGCVMQTQLDDADGTIVSFNTASENGATGILAQICAKRTTGADARKGMRLNFTRDGAYYGVGESTPIDADHEIAVKGDFKTTQIQLKEDAWVVEGSFYVQEISVTGIKATDNPIISAVYDGATPDEIREQQEEANKILKGETLDGKIKFYAEDDLGLDISALVRVM